MFYPTIKRHVRHERMTWAATDRARAGSPSPTLGAGSRLRLSPQTGRASRSIPPSTHCHSEQSEESPLVPTRMFLDIDRLPNRRPTTKWLSAPPLSSCTLQIESHSTASHALRPKLTHGGKRMGQPEVSPHRSRRRPGATAVWSGNHTGGQVSIHPPST
jgi:hypothetical protein